MDVYLKVPCIIGALITVQICTTPPHPPPAPDEKAASSRFEIVVKQRGGALLVRTLVYAIGIAEIAVILASSTVPFSCNVSRQVLEKLAFKPDKVDLRLSPSFVCGVALIYIGAFIRRACYMALGRMFTFEMSIRKDHRLITCGPYAVVRHPGYVGVLCMVAGLSFWNMGKGSWMRESGFLHTREGRALTVCFFAFTGTITVGLLTRMKKEDAALEKRFEQEWHDYAERVPYKLIPGIY